MLDVGTVTHVTSLGPYVALGKIASGQNIGPCWLASGLTVSVGDTVILAEVTEVYEWVIIAKIPPTGA